MTDARTEAGITTPPNDALRSALESALGAQYIILTLLGRGGMGAVYLARERLLERLVAIKVLPQDQADGDARERFVREARMAAQLSHPNIVPLLSFGEVGDMLFYVMRYVEGESLEARLKREGRLPGVEARRILGELADAIAEAHRLGIVHRDLKPDNVMIERDTGRAMLMDFGVARQVSGSATLTGTGMIVGSPQYMSPEQAAGDKVIDGRSDIYALGILGYRMLTGQLPFTGRSVRELVMQQLSAAPALITTIAPDTSHDLAAAITRCLEKDPALRWGDASAFRHAISGTEGAPVLPDAMDGLPGSGTRMLGALYVIGVALVSLYSYTRDREWLITGIVGPIFAMALSLMALAIRVRMAKLPFIPALRLMLWPAERSFLWWPASLRRPDDVFDRLPASVRRARGWLSACMMTMLFVAVPLGLAGFSTGCIECSEHALLRKSLILGGFAVMLGSVIGAGLTSIRALAWRKKWTLSRFEAEKLLSEPTHGSRFWERPAIARLLDDNRRIAPREAPRGGDALVLAVREIAAALPEAGSSIASESIGAAVELAAELRALDERISELARQADSAEQLRLEARLAALGPERSDEGDVARQMRALLRGQADLFRELETRRAELESRRNAMQEQLRTLWLQMANYHARLMAQDDSALELSARIRDLCRSIERHSEAVAETAQLG